MMPWIAPEILLTALACALLLVEAFAKPCPRRLGLLSFAGLLMALIITVLTPVTDSFYYWGVQYCWDWAAKFFKVFFLATAALVTFISLCADEESLPSRAEFFILPLLTTAGLCLLASTIEFMLLFVGLELVTISFYVLVAYQRSNALALEAGVKYLVLGALSSAFLVMGIAYTFGITGSTQFVEINISARNFLANGGLPLGLQFGLLLIIFGLAFKVAAVPFHLWAPDVYQGAPTSITAFLSVGSKAAGFILLMRVLLTAFASVHIWVPMLGALAGLSMLLGNLAAIPQRNLKRLLAYSSIGHTGFILLGVLAETKVPGLAVSVFIYLIAYLLANTAAFLVIAIAAKAIRGEQIHQFAGLWQRSPVLAGSLAIALISLGGIPPTAGFIGKLYIFAVTWQSGFYYLFTIGVIAAVVSLYYYLGVIKAMFWSEPLDSAPIAVSSSTKGLLVALSGLTLLLGLWPQGLHYLVHIVR